MENPPQYAHLYGDPLARSNGQIDVTLSIALPLADVDGMAVRTVVSPLRLPTA